MLGEERFEVAVLAYGRLRSIAEHLRGRVGRDHRRRGQFFGALTPSTVASATKNEPQSAIE